jgi:TetR/AcrR family transcriptional regulator, regulator of cefoperazone and chloramphenicol sensitivity
MTRIENDTRSNLLEAAKQLFADRGFRKVTVREICQAAGANVAAVNYHFQDKEGLYRAVLEEGIALMRETTDLSMRAPDGATPEDRLRTFVQTAVGRMMSRGTDSLFAKIIRHEFENPTEALDRVVERAIAPRLKALAGVVADVLGCDGDDPRVGPSVASIHVQLMLATQPFHVFGERMRLRRIPSAEELGQHIADFSLGGLAAVRGTDSHGRRRATRRG